MTEEVVEKATIDVNTLIKKLAAAGPSSRRSTTTRPFGWPPSMLALSCLPRALLDGAKDSLHEEAPRQVLADRLEDHGHGERAEFVRLRGSAPPVTYCGHSLSGYLALRGNCVDERRPAS